MSPDLTSQVTAGLLILVVFTVIAVTFLVPLLAARYSKKHGLLVRPNWPGLFEPGDEPRQKWQGGVLANPCRWFAIRTSNVAAVQSALHLHNPTPCSWGDGVARLTEHLFISPAIQGWILVAGQGIPDPADDIDQCFHLTLKLSRALGQVQFFSADRTVNHHAWVRVENGRIRRAYAWAGQTLWNQGSVTPAEKALGLKSYDYGEAADSFDLSPGDSHRANADKVNALAARWSLDPASVQEEMLTGRFGIVGDFLHSKPR